MCVIVMYINKDLQVAEEVLINMCFFSADADI